MGVSEIFPLVDLTIRAIHTYASMASKKKVVRPLRNRETVPTALGDVEPCHGEQEKCGSTRVEVRALNLRAL